MVKVGNISNLSDARYCSGMGVDMLGFTVIEGQDMYIDPALYQQLRGWIAGPSIVVELYGINESSKLSEVISNYLPDYLELNAGEILFLPSDITVPLIVTVNNKTDLNNLKSTEQKIAYVQVKDVDRNMIHDLAKDFPVILSLKSDKDVDAILKDFPVTGIALYGSPELRPGYKEYGDLSEVLEKLEDI